MEEAISNVLILNFNNSMKKELEPLGQLEELDDCSGMYIVCFMFHIYCSVNVPQSVKACKVAMDITNANVHMPAFSVRSLYRFTK